MELFGQQITAIAPLPRNEQMAVVKVENKRVATLSQAAIARLGLRVGGEWNEALAQRAADEEAYEAALHQASRWLDRRMLSAAELRAKLAGKGVTASIQDRVLARLEELGLINDAALGQLLIEQLRKKGGAGPALLRDRLLKRGLDESLAEELAQPSGDDGNGAGAMEEALALAEKKMRSMRGLDATTTRRRLAGALARRGFDQETVMAVLERLGFTSD